MFAITLIDAAALLRDHPLVRDLAAHVERPDEVVLHDREESVRRDVLRGRRELTAGVVDEDVDAGPTRRSRLDERLDLRGLADVAGRREHRRGRPVASCALAASSFSGVRPQIATLAPSRTSSVAVASPMPEPPPVTIAT